MRESMEKQSRPTVSVVMPVFNVEKYLKVAIESVLAQSFDDFELIIVDDGSTDDSASIYQNFATIDSRIIVLKQVNQGLAAARNTGIRNANGQYVALLDSDDFWHPDKLQRHVELLNSNPEVGVTYSASAFIDEQGKSIGLEQRPKCEGVSAKDVFLRNPIGNGSAAVIRKAVFDDIVFVNLDGGAHHNTQYFNVKLRQSEDIECWVRIATTTDWEFAGVNQALTYYRVNDSGLSANVEKQFQSWEKACNLMRNYSYSFTQRYFSLAAAFQFRYLARRAIRSQDRKKALNLVVKAIKTNPKILLLEPARSLITVTAALCLFLPRSWHNFMEYTGLKLKSKFQRA